MDNCYKPLTKLKLFSKVCYQGKKGYIVFIKFLDFQHFIEYLFNKEDDYDKVFFRDYYIFVPKELKIYDLYPTDLDINTSCKKIVLK